jgi:hypothetical protein
MNDHPTTIHNMKPSIHTTATRVIAVAFGLAIISSCSDKTAASLEVLKEKAEDKLVATAGEGKVALKLLHEEHAALREKLVTATTWKNTFQRRLSESEAAARQAEEAGDATNAAAHQRRADLYRRQLADFGDKDTKAAAELAAFEQSFESTKLEIQLLEEELAIHKAAAGLDNNLEANSPLESRAERIKELTESLKLKIDRAKAILQTSET